MKSGLLFFTLTLAAFSLGAQTEVKTEITAVNVYLFGAMETRGGAITLKKGENQIVLSGLSAHIVPNSIQVKGNSNYTISGVKHKINYLSKPKINPKIRAKMDSLENSEFLLSTRSAMRLVYQEEKAMIQANRAFNGDEKALMVEDIEEMANFYRSRMKEIEYKMIEVAAEEAKLRETINRLRSELDVFQTTQNQNTGEIHISLLASKNVDSPLEVSYMVYNCGWAPTYDLRSEELGANVELVYKAKVFQSTGTDWNNVMLTFSTGNPSEGGQYPTLYNWYIGLRDPGQTVYRSGNRDSEDKYAGAAMQEIAVSSMQIEGKSKSFSENNVVVRDNVVQTEFAISVPQTVPSDNQQYDIELQRISLNGAYEYFTAPKVDKDAFLIVHVTDWMKHNLLQGESNIYFKGSFVGNGYLDPMVNSDSLTFSMGRDKGIVVKREVVDNLSSTGIIGSKRKVTQGFEISVTNTKKQAVKLKLEDQIPVKTDGQIEVDTDELSGGQLNATTGKVTWQVDIAPGETKKIRLVYTVKYPKKKVLTNF